MTDALLLGVLVAAAILIGMIVIVTAAQLFRDAIREWRISPPAPRRRLTRADIVAYRQWRPYRRYRLIGRRANGDWVVANTPFEYQRLADARHVARTLERQRRQGLPPHPATSA